MLVVKLKMLNMKSIIIVIITFVSLGSLNAKTIDLNKMISSNSCGLDSGEVSLQNSIDDLDYFTAISEGGNKVVLAWRFNNEVDCEYFIIERSFDGMLWDFVADKTVDGKISNIEFILFDTPFYDGYEIQYRLIRKKKNGEKVYYDAAYLEYVSDSNSINYIEEM
jgi:hypothetical protein